MTVQTGQEALAAVQYSLRKQSVRRISSLTEFLKEENVGLLFSKNEIIHSSLRAMEMWKE